MGVLRPVVEALVGSMLDAVHELSFHGAIGSSLSATMARDAQTWRFNSLRIMRLAALALRRLYTRTSSTNPS